jgi:CDP-diacylglycerol--serine O-phosphatidyltransferase
VVGVTGRRRGVRRVVIVVPSLFTLGNLFLGIWAIVLAMRGDFYRAGWWVVIAGVLDVLDGRVARMSGAGTRFGAELDSLVDLVSFGVAPGIIMYRLMLQYAGGYAWVFFYAFVVCVALRLARYNAQPASPSRGPGFTGLPSPAAGMTLATYYPFTQSALYQERLTGLPWQQIIIFLMLALSLIMVSQVRYASLPPVHLRSARGLVGLAVHLTLLLFAVWSSESRNTFFFPLGVVYVTYGLARAALFGGRERDDEGTSPEGHRAAKAAERPQRAHSD